MTDNDFNAVFCSSQPNYFLGSSRLASLYFFTVTGGVKTRYTPVQMSSDDTVLNLANNVHFVNNGVTLTNCFRMPLEVPVYIDGSSSHFGFEFLPECFNTPAYCQAAQAQMNSYFLNLFTNNTFQLYLPGSRLDPNTNTLMTDIYFSPNLTLGRVKFNANTSLE